MSDQHGLEDAVRIERSFDAPVALVWELWTDPEHFQAWYGPEGATIPVAKMDVHVGGSRLVCMEVSTPNGPMQMWFAGEYSRSSSTGASCTPSQCPTSTATCSLRTAGTAPPRCASSSKTLGTERGWCWSTSASHRTPLVQRAGRWHWTSWRLTSRRVGVAELRARSTGSAGQPPSKGDEPACPQRSTSRRSASLPVLEEPRARMPRRRWPWLSSPPAGGVRR